MTPVPSDMSISFFENFLTLSGQAHLDLALLQFCRTVFRSQDLQVRFICCYWNVTPLRSSQCTEVKNICMYTQTHTHKHTISIFICTLGPMSPSLYPQFLSNTTGFILFFALSIFVILSLMHLLTQSSLLYKPISSHHCLNAYTVLV